MSRYTFTRTGAHSYTFSKVDDFVPTLLSAYVNNGNHYQLLLAFSCNLDETSIPATSAFNIGHTITGIAISDNIVTFTVSDAFEYEETITASYTKPGSNYLKSEYIKAVVSFSGQAVTNNIALDANASAFATAAGVTDLTMLRALNNFVISLKAINITLPNFVNFTNPASSILKASYPFIGGTATAHKLNLINPADTDAAYRLTFTGTVTHNGNGMTPLAGSSSYADTKFNVRTGFTSVDSNGIDIFMNSSIAASNNVNISARDNGTGIQYGIANSYAHGYAWARSYAANMLLSNKAKSKYIGLNQLDIEGTGIGQAKWRGNLQLLGSNVAAITENMPDVNLLIGCAAGFTSPGEIISYAGIRNAHISDAVNQMYFDAIVKLQSDLSRLPQISVYGDGHSMLVSTREILLPLLTDTFATRIFNWYCPAIDGSNLYATGVNITYNLTYRYSNAGPYGEAVKDMASKTDNNALIIWVGINDISHGETAANTWSRLLSCLNTAIADGMRPIVLTCTKTTTPAWAAGIADFNALLKANMPEGAQYIDLDLHPEFADPSNATYFADGIHLTTAGYTIVANDIVAKVNAI